MSKKSMFVIALVVMVALAAATYGLLRPAEVASPSEVTISNFRFIPQEYRIKTGTTVRWLNQDSTPHNIVLEDGSRKSRLLKKGEIYEHTFTAPGTYAYYCEPHPYMRAKVIVE